MSLDQTSFSWGCEGKSHDGCWFNKCEDHCKGVCCTSGFKEAAKEVKIQINEFLIDNLIFILEPQELL